jgi:hypothetical protein
MDINELYRQKFSTYRKVMDESGEQKAWDTLMQGYPERQRKNMGNLIKNTLAAGFQQAVPQYNQLGFNMVVVDISNRDFDAVLEIQKSCPALEQGLHKQYGFDKPCHVICDMDIAATNAAFKDEGMQGACLCRMAEGSAVCMFKYQRPKQK